MNNMTYQSSPLADRISAFLGGSPFAVVGASTSRAKFGNKVLRAYLQNQREVFPVNPQAEQVEGLPAYPDLASLPQKPHGLSIITPPKITAQILRDAAALGIRHVWIQPGAQSDEAVRIAEDAGMNIIAGDACLLVVLDYRELE